MSVMREEKGVASVGSTSCGGPTRLKKRATHSPLMPRTSIRHSILFLLALRGPDIVRCVTKMAQIMRKMVGQNISGCLVPPDKHEKFFCPCSCASDRSFETGNVHGGCRVRHAHCSKDGSAPRHRFLCTLWQRELSQMLPVQNLRVLHFAPEPSIALGLGLVASPRVELYVVSDFFRNPLGMIPSHLHRHVRSVKLDLQKIDYPDRHFDLVLCSRILEHVPDATSALREMARVLKPGGIGLISAPMNVSLAKTEENPNASQEEALRRFGQKDHKRSYGLDQPELMRAAGFNVFVYNTCEWYARQPEFKTVWRKLLNPEIKGEACEMHTVVQRPQDGQSTTVTWAGYTTSTPLTYMKEPKCVKGHWGEKPVF